MENAHWWQEIKEALEDRTAHTWWSKVPSHMDIEGNGQADRLAGGVTGVHARDRMAGKGLDTQG